MINCAVIENEIITNIIVAESVEIATEVTEKLCIELPDGFGIGDTWDGFNFIKATIVEG